MKPSHIYRFRLKEGTFRGKPITGTYQLESWTGPAPYPDFHVKAVLSQVETITLSVNYSKKGPRDPDKRMNNPEKVPSKRLPVKLEPKLVTGLFYLSTDFPRSFQGGSPPDDQDVFLGKETKEGGLYILVFQGMGMEKGQMFTFWTQGDIEGVEDPE